MKQKITKKSARQERIISALQINPAMRVNTLASELGVSSETVRRDLGELDRTGRLKRTYGGAVRTSSFEPALSERLEQYVEERERMAKQAVKLIDGADSLFVGGGASAQHFARALRLYGASTTVLTPALSIAVESATNPNIEVMVLPGLLDSKEGLVHGAETLQAISRFRTPFAVVGASALDGNSVSEALLTSAQIYSAIVDNAEHVIVLADQSKFGKRSLQCILTWGPDTTLLTDAYPADSLRKQIEDSGARIIVADAV